MDSLNCDVLFLTISLQLVTWLSWIGLLFVNEMLLPFSFQIWEKKWPPGNSKHIYLKDYMQIFPV